MKHFYEEIPGWFNFRNIYHDAVAKQGRKGVFVEVGSWKGRSTAYMAVEIANSQKRIDFYAVDSWDGGGDPHLADDPDLVNGTLYDVFLRNIEPARKLVTPIKAKSVDAAGMFGHDTIDFVFIDATHTYDAVKADIEAWLPRVKVGGTIAGDDVNWEGVAEAVTSVFGDKWERIGRSWRATKTEASGIDKGRFHAENLEGLTEWNINPRYWEGRRPGLSAMIRLKNEGQFLEYSVDSIIDWHDEVCLFPQGEQTDNSLEVCERLARKYPDKVKIFPYPFESIVNGPSHHMQPRGSVYERAYFYNWCLAKTTCEFANKWDGDMVAYDWLGGKVRELMKTKDGVKFRGIDLAGRKLDRVSKNPHTASELRVHRVTEDSFYYTTTHCEHLSLSGIERHKIANSERIREHGFIHLKWCKDNMADSTVGWPSDWEETHQYYSNIVDNKRGDHPYLGDYPTAIKSYLAKIA